MKTIIVNQAALNALIAKGASGKGARQVATGFEIEVDHEVAQILEAIDPDPSTAILQITMAGRA